MFSLRKFSLYIFIVMGQLNGCAGERLCQSCGLRDEYVFCPLSLNLIYSSSGSMFEPIIRQRVQKLNNNLF